MKIFAYACAKLEGPRLRKNMPISARQRELSASSRTAWSTESARLCFAAWGVRTCVRICVPTSLDASWLEANWGHVSPTLKQIVIPTHSFSDCLWGYSRSRLQERLSSALGYTDCMYWIYAMYTSAYEYTHR